MKEYHIHIKHKAPAISDYEMVDVAIKFILDENKSGFEISSSSFIDIVRYMLLSRYNNGVLNEGYKLNVYCYNRNNQYIGKRVYQEWTKPSWFEEIEDGFSERDLEDVFSVFCDYMFLLMKEQTKLSNRQN